jgi:hypothetical protein
MLYQNHKQPSAARSAAQRVREVQLLTKNLSLGTKPAVGSAAESRRGLVTSAEGFSQGRGAEEKEIEAAVAKAETAVSR